MTAAELSAAERFVRDEIEAGLDARFAKLEARLAAFGTVGESIDRLAAAQVEAAQASEEGPALRHRMNLASMCYGIRLRALCEQRPDEATRHVTIAALAVSDADALIAALSEKP